MPQNVYISITGLRVRRFYHLPSFWSHALRSMAQARKAPGNLFAEARKIDGIHHTLSVWTDRDAMRAYLTSGPHLDAMRLFPRIAAGRVVGFHAPHAPDWAEVPAIWSERGRVV